MAEKKQKRNGFVDGCCAVINKYMPDAFIFAIALTLVVLIATIIVVFVEAGKGNGADYTFIKRIVMIVKGGWYNGFWSLLSFTMQMALVVVTGSILANTPQVKKGLIALAKKAKTPAMAVWLVAFVGIIVSWINWGAALIVGAILAKEIAKQLKGVHYPLLVAAGYLGLGLWHGGFSGSIPLQIATVGASVGSGAAKWVSIGIPFSYTIFAPYCFVIYVVSLIVLPLVMAKSHPAPDKVITVDPKVFADDKEVEDKYDRKTATPAVKLEHSKFLNYFIVVMGAISIIMYFVQMAQAHQAFSVDLNFVNFLFLIISMALYKTPIRTVYAVNEVAAGAAGVMLQFPFYGGLSNLMTYTESANAVSLVKLLSELFVNISTPFTFSFWVWISAGILNLFVPSGGGQWAVQGPIIMMAVQDPKFSAGKEPAAVQGKAAMSVAWGDCWTNLIQPFWALPLLAVAKLQARDIMGYCVICLLVLGLIIALCLLFL